MTDATVTTNRTATGLSWRERGTGPAVLLVQGTGVPGDGWLPQVDALAGEFRCIWFDNRGLGRSGPLGPGRLTVAAMAADALEVLDAAGCDTAHVVGHSLGGPISVELALAARDRVRSLSLLCSFADGRDIGRPTAWMIWAGLRTLVGTRRMRRRAFLDFILSPGERAEGDRDARAASLGRVFGRDLADRPAIINAQLAALKASDHTARLGELAGLPTLVLSAEHDRIAPPALGRRLAAGIPGAEYAELPGTAHACPVVRPEPVNVRLLAHLRRHTPEVR